ncbi:MAG: hypothetical protein ABSD42_07515 [Candidatus Bathyarchaeia archaeon]|jgi:hypothetical protein
MPKLAQIIQRKIEEEKQSKGLSIRFTYDPKAMRFKNEKGYVVKRKAKLNHSCHRCYNAIPVNTEYYQLHYYGSWNKYPICENCWSGRTMESKNPSQYQETSEFAESDR